MLKKSFGRDFEGTDRNTRSKRQRRIAQGEADAVLATTLKQYQGGP